jgi:hypothetical protein
LKHKRFFIENQLVGFTQTYPLSWPTVANIGDVYFNVATEVTKKTSVLDHMRRHAQCLNCAIRNLIPGEDNAAIRRSSTTTIALDRPEEEILIPSGAWWRARRPAPGLAPPVPAMGHTIESFSINALKLKRFRFWGTTYCGHRST